MDIRCVTVEGFTCHEDTRTLDLPEQGTVLITGANGSGKSSWIEAVSWCLWGKTLRGGNPWQPGRACRVVVETADMLITRERTAKGGNKLKFRAPGKPSAQHYDTATKAQEALLEHVGTWEAWRRTHVLSSADAAAFTSATDAGRKRLLEEVVGLDGIDTALQAISVRVHDIRLQLGVAERERTLLTQAVEGARSALAELPDVAPGDTDVEAKRKEHQSCKDARREIRADIVAAQRRRHELGKQEARNAARIEQLKRELAVLAEDSCRACGQPLPTDQREAQRAAAEKELATAEQCGALWVEQMRDIDANLDEYESELEEYHQWERECEGVLRSIEEHERSQAVRGKLEASLDTHEDKLREAVEAAKRLGVEYTLYSEARRILGPTGFRGHLLASAVEGMETLANDWLEAMQTDTRVRIQAGEDGKIDFGAEGVGGGDYRGASGGERRRIDVAVLLALSEMAHAARGTRGTLWLDEVFDALDSDGVSGVRSALARLGEERAIVVITHSADLADGLAAAVSLEM